MDTKQILLRKVKYSDSSVGYFLCIKQAAILTEVKLKKYQYDQLKGKGVFTESETDFSKNIPAN